jgi:hypothetical protein
MLLLSGGSQVPVSEAASDHSKGDFPMLTKTKTALAAALIIGSAAFGAVSAFASDNSGDYTGGFVVPGANGVNPAYHPVWFGQNRKGADAFGSAVIRHAPAATAEDNYGSEAGKN